MERYIYRIICSLILIGATSEIVLAQAALQQPKSIGTPIQLKNPSFEDESHVGTRHGSGPKGWRDCGANGETAPDVHSGTDSIYFEVKNRPSEGKTFLGLVVRDNITWEAIGQRLREPLIGGNCYNFSIDLSRAKKYVSLSRQLEKEVNYERAVVLRVWGGNNYCSKMELLDETDAVENFDWKTYNLRFEPSRHYSCIMLEAFYKTPVFFEYNGNLLLDNASEIVPVPCNEAPEPPIAVKEEPLLADASLITKPRKKPKPPRNNNNNNNSTKPYTEPDDANRVKPQKKKKEYVKELNDKLVVGQEITLKKLNFDADSSRLAERFFPIIDDVYDFLVENENVIIEIGGHTNNRCEDVFCNGLSEARAKSVANYLIRRGIMRRRVEFKGYGKSNQKYPNNTPTNRRRNQRVEIKILSKG